MTTVDKLRALARELAGEAWDYERRGLVAQAYVRCKAAIALMNQVGIVQHEDAIFEDHALTEP